MLRTYHPQYSTFLQMWLDMRIFHEGQRAVKDKGVSYLPPTAGMILDGMLVNEIGYKAYQAYRDRAIFPDYIREGVEALMGLIHQHDAKFILPPRMEYLRTNATINGESLLMLLRKMNEEQLVTGRLGLLVDLPANPDPTNPEPFVSMYSAETVINWDDGTSKVGENKLNFVVLDESCYIREGFNWVWRERYRVLELSGAVEGGETLGAYSQGLFTDGTYNALSMTAPTLRGKGLNEIPFTFVNTKDCIAPPDYPPLMGLGETCLTIYRGEADYRQNLHMQGQDTLAIVGGIRNPNAIPGDTDAIRVGAGSRLDIELGGDAKFIGVSSLGLSEQRNAIENDRKRAEFKAGQLIGNQSLKNESGNAMIARLAAQTANLNQIAMSSGEGLERALKNIATWLGEDPSKVKVIPNTEFTNAASNAQELVYLMTARKMGAPLSMFSIHESLKDKGYTTMEYDEEKALVKTEGPNDEPSEVRAVKAPNVKSKKEETAPVSKS